MKITQAWVGYAARSYEVIKRSILNRLGVTAPEITDHSESNPFIILISAFAGVGEIIHLYLDSIGREAFIGTARRYSSIIKLAKLVDYYAQARVGATADILFTLLDNTNTPAAAPDNIFIPIGTLIYPLNSNVPFRTTEDIFLPKGYSSIYIPVEQYTRLQSEIIGVTSVTSTPNQVFPLSSKYVNKSLKITINGEEWIEYPSFGLMGSTTKGFVAAITEDREAVLIFGDGVNGLIPATSQTIYGDYQESEGYAGNLPPGSITQLQSNIDIPGGYTLIVTNPDYSSGGADFETLEDVRRRAPMSIRTLMRAVTYQDYIDLAELIPGVGAAEARNCCGKYVDLYIVPSSRGTATTALINRVKSDMQCRIMITTRIDVKPAGTSRIWLKARIIGQPLAKAADILQQVYAKWDELYGYENVKINGRVSITDIIASTEPLPLVDTLEIQELRIEPFVRPTNNTDTKLNIEFSTLAHSTIRLGYKLVYKQDTTNFQLYKNGGFVGMLAIGDTFNDGLIGFSVLAGVYQDKDTWELTVHPSFPEIFPQTLVEITDFSAPVISISPFVNNETPRTIFGDIEVVEQGTTQNCLPNCN